MVLEIQDSPPKTQDSVVSLDRGGALAASVGGWFGVEAEARGIVVGGRRRGRGMWT